MKITEAQLASGNIVLGVGTYVLPPNFSYDYGSKNVTIQGIAGKTIITSYDGKAATNFKPVKLDTTKPDTFPDGQYVVWKHPIYSYGGGQAHLNLKGVYNTNGLDCFYTQGTILVKKNKIWSRHYTGYGFKTKGNMTIKNVTFDNCQFYLFSPFGLSKTESFTIDNCIFKNVSRVIASMSYSGIDMKPEWFTHLQCYPSNGDFRFKNFTIKNSTFSQIHTSIVWGFPPAETTNITDNTIKDSNTIITAFNFMMKNYNDVNYFATRTTQTITGNTFSNIITENSWTTSLIRTAGLATVTGNTFLQVSPQITHFYGGDSLFKLNTITKYNTSAEIQPVVLLNKSPESMLTIQENKITANLSILLAVENQSSCLIYNNNVTCKTIYSRNYSTNTDASITITSNIASTAIVFNASSKIPATIKSVTITDNTLSNLEASITGNTMIQNLVYQRNTVLTK